MKYSWISPQEDEFALLTLGARSPYQALITPSLMLQPSVLLDPRCQPLADQEHWGETLKYFVRLLTVQNDKPILLKSPPHGFRMPLLLSLFPGARFVIIDRNPYEVFASNLKLWRTLLEMYSLEPFTDQQIEDFVLAAYLVHEDAIGAGTQSVRSGLIARVRYEDLVADSPRQLARLYSELGLAGFEEMRPHLEQYLAATANHTRNHFVLSQAQKERIQQKWGPIIDGKGYACSSNYITLTSGN